MDRGLFWTDYQFCRSLNQRRGQAMFNALSRLDPELASIISTTEFDPFYDDSKCEAFLREIGIY